MVRASLTIAMLNPIERGLRDVLGHRGTVARRAASSDSCSPRVFILRRRWRRYVGGRR